MTSSAFSVVNVNEVEMEKLEQTESTLYYAAAASLPLFMGNSRRKGPMYMIFALIITSAATAATYLFIVSPLSADGQSPDLFTLVFTWALFIIAIFIVLLFIVNFFSRIIYKYKHRKHWHMVINNEIREIELTSVKRLLDKSYYKRYYSDENAMKNRERELMDWRDSMKLFILRKFRLTSSSPQQDELHEDDDDNPINHGGFMRRSWNRFKYYVSHHVRDVMYICVTIRRSRKPCGQILSIVMIHSNIMHGYHSVCTSP